MGIERRIRIAEETPVPWSAIRARLLAIGETPALRMIDGQLAFPDEEPPQEWQELRVALKGGMVTLRKSRDVVVAVTWGNADAALEKSWNLLTWAVADMAQGMIVEDTIERTPAEFAALLKLLPA